MVVVTVDSKGLIDRISAYLPQEAAELVEKAFVFADQCHQGQMRVSGEPYIAHPLETALFLANLHLDHHPIVAIAAHVIRIAAEFIRSNEPIGDDGCRTRTTRQREHQS